MNCMSIAHPNRAIKYYPHIKGNILDLVITENRDNYFQDAITSKLDVSDHFLVSFRPATKLEACT